MIRANSDDHRKQSKGQALTNSFQSTKQGGVLRIVFAHQGLQVSVVHHIKVVVWIEGLARRSPSNGFLRRKRI